MNMNIFFDFEYKLYNISHLYFNIFIDASLPSHSFPVNLRPPHLPPLWMRLSNYLITLYCAVTSACPYFFFYKVVIIAITPAFASMGCLDQGRSQGWAEEVSSPLISGVVLRDLSKKFVNRLYIHYFRFFFSYSIDINNLHLTIWCCAMLDHRECLINNFSFMHSLSSFSLRLPMIPIYPFSISIFLNIFQVLSHNRRHLHL